MKDNINEMISSARGYVDRLSRGLPQEVDPAAISLTAKIPYKALCFREALLWRTEELSRVACHLYEQMELASAITLTRATAENAAAMWYLFELISGYAGSQSDKLDEKMMQLLMGSRTNDDLPKAVNVLTMFERAEKSVPGVVRSYGLLSEYAHPNWSGTSLIYSGIDREKMLTIFDKPKRRSKSASVGLSCLIGSLQMFGYAYNELADVFPSFVSLCENDLRK